ncbi:MAG: SWIM zinc finger domain-containing protein, partial [Anaerolineae bacterium]
MKEAFSLTESQIRAWVDVGSFERGWGYFEGGHILNPRRQGNTLKACCLGSMPTPYRLQVTLGSEGIVAGDCSCPVGAGGHCKHVV